MSSIFRKGPPPLTWRRNLPRLAIALLAYVVGLLILLYLWPAASRSTTEDAAFFLPVIIVTAYFFQVTDSVAGMGFGTAMVPILVAFGYSPLAVVPMLLIVQSFSGLIAGWLHHEVGNVELSFRPLNDAGSALLLIVATGSVASVVSIIVVYAAWSPPEKIIETYIGVLVIAMGGVAALARMSRRRGTYRQNRLVGFAVLAGINKGIGSSGYGPLITLGGIYAGIGAKSAVSLTTLAEGLVSLCGAIAFVILMKRGMEIDLSLLPSVLSGSFLAAVTAPYVVRVFPQHIFRWMVPAYAVAVGVFLLLKIHVF